MAKLNDACGMSDIRQLYADVDHLHVQSCDAPQDNDFRHKWYFVGAKEQYRMPGGASQAAMPNN